MKKTIRSLMTAAVFSAAVTSSLHVSAQEAALLEKTAQPMAPLYGPPWVFASLGDVNYDNSIDARDVTLLKRSILEENFRESDLYLGDLNNDGSLDKEDVQALIRMLTGKPEDEDEPAETTTITETTLTNTDVTTTTTLPVTIHTLYGPPPAWI